MAHRTPKINDTVKFTDQQQAILNDAVEQLMEAGGLTALTQAHFNEAMKIVAQRFMADTLALGYVLGATPCTRDFHPLERAHAERTMKKPTAQALSAKRPSLAACPCYGQRLSGTVVGYFRGRSR